MQFHNKILVSGDTADGFAFATFFPNVIQPPIAGLGNVLFTLLVKVRVCRRPIRRYDVGGGSVAGAPVGAGGPSISISLPGVDNHDTERRRQIALKALSDRLNKAGGPAKEGGGKTAWPAMEQEAQPLIPPAVEGPQVCRSKALLVVRRDKGDLLRILAIVLLLQTTNCNVLFGFRFTATSLTTAWLMTLSWLRCLRSNRRQPLASRKRFRGNCDKSHQS